MKHPILQKLWDEVSTGTDRDHYLLVGYFITWFNHVELAITFLLAFELQIGLGIAGEARDFEDFELFTQKELLEEYPQHEEIIKKMAYEKL